jgi:hypothetical protein
MDIEGPVPTAAPPPSEDNPVSSRAVSLWTGNILAETGLSENKLGVSPVSSPELKLEMALDIGLNCQGDRSEKAVRRPSWRRECPTNYWFLLFATARRCLEKPLK